MPDPVSLILIAISGALHAYQINTHKALKKSHAEHARLLATPAAATAAVAPH